MKTFLMVAALLLTSTGVRAEGFAGQYWVVGSFKSLNDAKVERLRLQKPLNESVRIARADVSGSTMYRLVVAVGTEPSMQKRQLVAAGTSPWRLKVAPGQLNFVSTASASKIEYRLVVGSFSARASADRLAHKLTTKGFSMVSTAGATAGNETRYRVMLGPYTSRSTALKHKADQSGIMGAWWLATAVPAPQATASMAATSTPQHTTMAAESQVQTVPRRAAGSSTMAASQADHPPAPNENIIAYCTNKANAIERKRYCTDADIRRVMDRRLVADGAGGHVYVEFCTQEANAAERMKYCTDKEAMTRLQK